MTAAKPPSLCYICREKLVNVYYCGNCMQRSVMEFQTNLLTGETRAAEEESFLLEWSSIKDASREEEKYLWELENQLESTEKRCQSWLQLQQLEAAQIEKLEAEVAKKQSLCQHSASTGENYLDNSQKTRNEHAQLHAEWVAQLKKKMGELRRVQKVKLSQIRHVFHIRVYETHVQILHFNLPRILSVDNLRSDKQRVDTHDTALSLIAIVIKQIYDILGLFLPVVIENEGGLPLRLYKPRSARKKQLLTPSLSSEDSRLQVASPNFEVTLSLLHICVETLCHHVQIEPIPLGGLCNIARILDALCLHGNWPIDTISTVGELSHHHLVSKEEEEDVVVRHEFVDLREDVHLLPPVPSASDSDIEVYVHKLQEQRTTTR